jgi:hypothetical protein
MAAAFPLDAMEPALLMRVLGFLQVRELAAVAAATRACRVAALDESVWRDVTLRAFPAAADAPVPYLWRAEFKARRDAAARQAEYQRAMMMGMAGLRKREAGRLEGERLSYFDSPAGRRTQEAARRAAEEAAAAAASHSIEAAAAAVRANIDAASQVPRVAARQGSCSWSVLPLGYVPGEEGGGGPQGAGGGLAGV